jgi:hypothetical protein
MADGPHRRRASGGHDAWQLRRTAHRRTVGLRHWRPPSGSLPSNPSRSYPLRLQSRSPPTLPPTFRAILHGSCQRWQDAWNWRAAPTRSPLQSSRPQHSLLFLMVWSIPAPARCRGLNGGTGELYYRGSAAQASSSRLPSIPSNRDRPQCPQRSLLSPELSCGGIGGEDTRAKATGRS